MLVRYATDQDVEAITRIYNYYITDSVITFELDAISKKEMNERFKSISSVYPYLVGLVDDEVIGYAYAGRWKERKAYDNTVETSIYLANNATGKGYGKELYSHLLREIKNQKIRLAIGGVTLPNEASVKLHESLGYKFVGKFTKVGYKFNQWLDVGYWELDLYETEFT